MTHNHCGKPIGMPSGKIMKPRNLWGCPSLLRQSEIRLTETKMFPFPTPIRPYPIIVDLTRDRLYAGRKFDG